MHYLRGQAMLLQCGGQYNWKIACWKGIVLNSPRKSEKHLERCNSAVTNLQLSSNAAQDGVTFEWVEKFEMQKIGGVQYGADEATNKRAVQGKTNIYQSPIDGICPVPST